ncbi:MAG TPA: hypothetical protein PLF81_20135, partial [Candidatus Anammoximicrobium sp.]|nr:hypothetical protein [Candidatus Anammoximicrobium sp.]
AGHLVRAAFPDLGRQPVVNLLAHRFAAGRQLLLAAEPVELLQQIFFHRNRKAYDLGHGSALW